MVYPGGYATEIDDPYRYGRVVSDYDLYLFGEGNHTRIYDKLGAHVIKLGAVEGTHFAVWAPNAERVSVVGDFNGWDGRRPSDAVARFERHLGDLPAWRPRRAALQVRDPFRRSAASCC